MTTYKVSYVITGSDDPGSIVNADRRPEIGERVKLGEKEYVIIEVLDLMPPRGEFHYIHVTCRPLQT